MIRLECKLVPELRDDGKFQLVLEPFDAGELLGWILNWLRTGEPITENHLLLFLMEHIVDWSGILGPDGQPRPFSWELFRTCFCQHQPFAIAVVQRLDAYLKELTDGNHAHDSN